MFISYPVQLSQSRVVVLPFCFQVKARCCGDEGGKYYFQKQTISNLPCFINKPFKYTHYTEYLCLTLTSLILLQMNLLLCSSDAVHHYQYLCSDPTRAGPAFLVTICSDLMAAFRLLVPGFNKTYPSEQVRHTHVCLMLVF